MIKAALVPKALRRGIGQLSSVPCVLSEWRGLSQSHQRGTDVSMFGGWLGRVFRIPSPVIPVITIRLSHLHRRPVALRGTELCRATWPGSLDTVSVVVVVAPSPCTLVRGSGVKADLTGPPGCCLGGGDCPTFPCSRRSRARRFWNQIFIWKK